VQPLGADRETNPDQRNVEERDQCHHCDASPNLAFYKKSYGDHDQDDHEGGDDDGRHPIGFPVQTALERKQQLAHRHGPNPLFVARREGFQPDSTADTRPTAVLSHPMVRQMLGSISGGSG
jgi:hypothetical protein